MAKVGKKLVAMCSLAVGLIYAGAYAATADQASPSNTAGHTNDSQTGNIGVGSDSGATNSQPASQQLYKDGTYTGSGSDRRGTLQVAVTIQKGKISDVEINNYDMRYSESYIDPVLPQEVIQQQNDNVDVISGATASSENFQMAIQQALDEAKGGT